MKALVGLLLFLSCVVGAIYTARHGLGEGSGALALAAAWALWATIDAIDS